MACLAAGLAFALTATTGISAQITTSQYNNARTGATLNETVLTPADVNSREFGKLGSFRVDGAVYAQPLFLPGVEVPGKGIHDVLYVATEHDRVYTFDANQPAEPPLWRVNFLARGVTTVSEDDVQCPFIRPEIGITSTPVIDLQSGTIYVPSRTKKSLAGGPDEYRQELHALAINTGA